MTLSEGREPIRMAVDLTSLQVSGFDGRAGSYLSALNSLVDRKGESLVVVYIVREGGMPVARRRARPVDEIHGLYEAAESIYPTRDSCSPRERGWRTPPSDLLHRLRVHLQYCPLGTVAWRGEDIPLLVSLVNGMTGEGHDRIENVEARTGLLTVIAAADLVHVQTDFYSKTLESLAPSVRTKLVCARLFDFSPPDWARRLLWVASNIAPSFVYAPADAPEDNHQVLLIAYRMYRQRCARGAWDLVLVSDNPTQLATWQNLVRTLAIESGIRFEKMSASDSTVSLKGPVVWVDPVSSGVIDAPIAAALALGIPLICNHTAERAEIGGDACLYFDSHKPVELADALTRITEEPGLSAQLLERAGVRRRAMEADIQIFAAGIEALAAKRRQRGKNGANWGMPHPIRDQLQIAARLERSGAQHEDRLRWVRNILSLAVHRGEPETVIIGWLEVVAYAEASVKLAVSPINPIARRQWLGLAMAALLRGASRLDMRIPLFKLREMKRAIDVAGS
jgi:hypothetical protein